LLISPIPAALTKESPHALRSILSLPCYAIISGFGLGYFIGNYKKYSSAILVITSLVFLLFFGLYLNNFFSNYSALSASDWQYQYKEVFAEYSLDMKNANKIIITDEYAPALYICPFLLKYDLCLVNVHFNSVDRWGFSRV
jgi:hypothetical protein